MAFFKNLFSSSASSVASSSDERSIESKSSSTSARVDALHAPTICYGAEGFVDSTSRAQRYIQDQGYFSKKTRVARNSMYDTQKQRK